MITKLDFVALILLTITILIGKGNMSSFIYLFTYYFLDEVFLTDISFIFISVLLLITMVIGNIE